MKKLLFLIVALSIMMGCKKASYVAKFDESPQKRAADQINLVSTTLTSSPNGWIATLPTGAGGGYSFYMNFDNNQNVIMYGDMTDKSATVAGKSYYRVKQDIGTDLVFDSYNYISMLNDPDQNVLGGAAKLGYNSDNDFTYDRSSADSIVFIGKKFRQPFKLIKATAAQKASYEGGEFKIAIDKFNSFFATTQNPYIEIVSGTATLKAGISVNSTNNLSTGKRVNLTGLLANGTSTLSATAKYASKLNGADLLGVGLTYSGVTFVRIEWKGTSLAFYDSAGKEYVIKSNPIPLTPLKALMAYNGTYKGINIGTSLPTGVTSAFNTAYNSCVTKFGSMNPKRTLVSVRFLLLNSTTATVTTQNNNGTTTFSALATYNYTLIDGVLTLSNPVYDGNWTARTNELIDIQNYFLGGPFKLDWVTSSDPANKSLMGGLYRVADPTSFYYGTL